MKLASSIVGLVLLVSMACVTYLPASSVHEEQDFTERVNLAMRMVGHQLLTLEGDSTSSIPPVENHTEYSFALNLQSKFNYDTLPAIIQNALNTFQIHHSYHVVIERCSDNKAMLGYNFESLNQGQVACAGRDQLSDCNNIVITFEPPFTSTASGPLWLPGLLIALSFIMVGFIVWKKRSNQNGSETHSESTDNDDSDVKQLGKFSFDHKNQTLQIGGQSRDLTFRESKLLHHLVLHSNQIRSRDELVDEVWGDEGVMVGRSLDVFISRLRKLLKADESISIKTIHGVGYRLEVNPS